MLEKIEFEERQSKGFNLNYLSSSYSHYFLNTYITNLLQNYKE